MSTTLYFSSVTSESTFRARFQAENRKTFSELNHVAASSWGRAHLLACRVVRREPLHNLLPILSGYMPSTMPPFPNEITSFLEGPDLALLAGSEHNLVPNSGYGIAEGQIWAAMAQFRGNQDRRVQGLSITQEGNESELARRQSSRVRREIDQSDFTNSGEIQIGSTHSSRSSHSSEDSSLGYLDLDAQHQGITPEDDTLRLASCVIRRILYFAPLNIQRQGPLLLSSETLRHGLPPLQ
ncbi:hypothetical protein CBS147332_5717 [Penicillium roqueforti]|nr:hypothetical protein CBS147332_5717 [Penicillium roqueforti]KAI3111927.1 hypothetical protein CBS147331_4481 [Penicillium roqueforti]